MITTEERPAGLGSGWTLLLPPGWATLPTGEAEGRVAVRRLTDRMLKGRPRDELIQLRIDLEQTLLAQLARARQQGATAFHVLVEPVRGLPVSASLVVSELTVTDDPALGEALGRMFGTGDGIVESAATTLGELSAVRRVRRHQDAIEGDVDQTPFWHTNVDYVIDTAPGTLLMLNFATSTDPVAEQLVFLFDAIAGTLHRRADADPDPAPAPASAPEDLP